ncbi:unnamed protein product [Aphanomyces euteiches]
MQRAALVLLSAFAGVVHSHAWIDCSNYIIETGDDALHFKRANCIGFPRCAAERMSENSHRFTKSVLGNGVFGLDSGLAYLQSVKGCQCDRSSSNAYTDATPMATYTPGQRVCLAYPAKNHVADVCTNQYIPDNGMKIYRSDEGATTDPDLHKWPHEIPHLNGVHTDGQIDYKGFQNCPAFCENNGTNMDKALCTVCFDLEPDLALGSYTFHWEWQFNEGQWYVSCWEANVVASTPSLRFPSPTAGGTPSTGASPSVVPNPAPSPATTPHPSVARTPSPSHNYGRGYGDEIECS